MPLQPEDFLEFDCYRIDAGQRVLLSSGTPVPLSPKVFDTLLALVEQPGRVLEKDYLLKRIWPDTFVEEGSLARNVSSLRKLLGRSPDGQEYIETIPKRGYRFRGPVRRSPIDSVDAGSDVVPVGASPDGTGEPDVAPADIVARRVPRSGVALASGVGLLVVIAGLLGAWGMFASEARPGAIDSVAVLPFLILSANQDGDYVADGLTEELIDALANIPGLRVVSRTTVFQFKNQAGDVRALGKRLQVDAVIEGSVRRDGDRIRVTVQLNSVRDGYHYWSQTWDRDVGNILDLQQDIARQVAESLRPSEGGVVIAGAPRTADREAHNLYLQAQFHRWRGTLSGMNRAEALYKQAIERDPTFAEAYVGLAMLYYEAGTDGRLPVADTYPKAKQAVARALELNPLLSSVYAARGFIEAHYDWNWSASERDSRRAIEMNPTDPESHHAYSHLLLAMGRYDESLVQSRRAIDLDPLNAGMRSHLALHFDFAGDLPAAIDAAKAALEIDPADAGAVNFALYAHESLGQFDHAIDARAKLGASAASITALRRGLAAQGAQGYWRALRDGELAKSKQGKPSSCILARAYARLGERREALEWLEQAFRDRDGWLIYLNSDANFDGIRGDPRFEAFVARIGLPPRR